MAIICWKYRLLFIMTPRTACTAVGELLCKELEGVHVPPEDVLYDNGLVKVQRKHSTLSELYDNGMLSPSEAESLIKFTTVRNPFDSLVSLYVKKRFKYQALLNDPNSWVHKHPQYKRDMQFAREHSFRTWLLKHERRNLARRLLGRDASMYGSYSDGMDVILRYETLDADFSTLLRTARIERNLRIPVVNTTEERSGNDYRRYYSSLTRLLVKFSYRRDLREYGYGF